jgi:hypothetical protein
LEKLARSVEAEVRRVEQQSASRARSRAATAPREKELV